MNTLRWYLANHGKLDGGDKRWGQRLILGVILDVEFSILDFGLVVQVERFMLAFGYP